MVANKVLTLAFIRQSSQILLGFKKRGFGQGRWNGFGGKVQAGETIEEGAKRELHEECGLEAANLDKIGLLMFEFLGDPQLMEVHVYKTETYSGIVTESDEMRPKWFDIKDIPYPDMWPDDHLWFPHMLTGKQFYGYFTFKGMNDIMDYSLRVVPDVHALQIPNGPQISCG